MSDSKPELALAIASARRVLTIEAEAVSQLVDRVDENLARAVEHLVASPGRTIVCGIGKSGIIAHKIAATLASTGTPAFFMHPAEAFHGDLGMVTPTDTFIAISNSGETDEVLKLLPFLTDNGNYVIALTGNLESTLASAADCHIYVGVDQEACPMQLAPTSSTTATLAMGDALAVAVMEARGFREEDFARFHPGGSLGRRLLSRVEHEMVPAPLPALEPSSSLPEVISAITGWKLGFALVTTTEGYAIITDGDLRRAIERHGQQVFALAAENLMTLGPASVPVGTRVEDALAKMERLAISALLVFDDEDLVGIIKK